MKKSVYIRAIRGKTKVKAPATDYTDYHGEKGKKIRVHPGNPWQEKNQRQSVQSVAKEKNG